MKSVDTDFDKLNLLNILEGVIRQFEGLVDPLTVATAKQHTDEALKNPR